MADLDLQGPVSDSRRPTFRSVNITATSAGSITADRIRLIGMLTTFRASELDMLKC